MLFWHGSPVPLGVDFKGGTQVRCSSIHTPNEDHIRQAMDAAGIKDARISASPMPGKSACARC
jgi:preprotein translocase subunit SecF